MNPKEFVTQFIEEYLGGDISRLATFPLGNLRNDKVYGCPNRNFDSDDTELMRAIYCLVFGEVWENLSMNNLGDGKLRGDTLNTYNTLFSQPWNEKFTAIWNPDDEFEWHDYEDRFLEALYLVLTGDSKRDLDLEELVELNKEDFMPFYGKEGWAKFVEGNLLMDYVDSGYVPVVRSKGYTYWRGGYTNRDRFIAECHRYIDDSTEIINTRASLMIKTLKNKLEI